MADSDHSFPLGTFVYDADAPWDALRSGMITSTADDEPGVWFESNSVEELKQPPIVHPLPEFAGRICPHILMHALRGRADDGCEPYRDIYWAALRLVRSAKECCPVAP